MITGGGGLGKRVGVSNQLTQWSFLEDRDAKNLQERKERNLQIQPFLIDRGKNIDRDCRTNLSFYSVLRGSEKRLDSKILLDPSKEQLVLPAELMKRSNRQGRKSEVVRQKDQVSIVSPVIITNPVKPLRKSSMRRESGQGNDLAGSDIRSLIYRTRIKPITSQARPGSDNEEGMALMKSEESAIIHITAVKDIVAPQFEEEFVQNFHVVRISIRNTDKRRNNIPQVNKCMKLAGPFILAENRPGKMQQAKIGRCRIKNINSAIQFEAEILIGIKGARLGDEGPGKIGIDPPIASFIGMSQGIEGNSSAKSHVIKPAFHGSEAGLDIAKTFTISQLGKGQTKELVVTRKALVLVVAAIPLTALSKVVHQKKIHNLEKDGRRGVHLLLLWKGDDNTKRRSNRLRSKTQVSYT